MVRLMIMEARNRYEYLGVFGFLGLAAYDET